MLSKQRAGQTIVDPIPWRYIYRHGMGSITFYYARSSTAGWRGCEERRLPNGRTAPPPQARMEKKNWVLARKACNSATTEGGIHSSENWEWRRSRRLMYARLEMGEVLLTASIGQILREIVKGIVARDIALADQFGEGVNGSYWRVPLPCRKKECPGRRERPQARCEGVAPPQSQAGVCCLQLIRECRGGTSSSLLPIVRLAPTRSR